MTILEFPSSDKKNKKESASASTRPRRKITVELPPNWRAWTDVKYLKQVLTSEERERLESMQYSWPNLYSATLKLASQITCFFPGQERALLAESVGKAFRAYEDKAPGRSTASDQQAQIAYMRALSDASADVLKYAVYGTSASGQSVLWQPFKRSIAEWARKEGLDTVIFEPSKEFESMVEIAPQILANRILETEDLLLITENSKW
jgi:hypothetical protein